jgi:aspartate ammonia-lyase
MNVNEVIANKAIEYLGGKMGDKVPSHSTHTHITHTYNTYQYIYPKK